MSHTRWNSSKFLLIYLHWTIYRQTNFSTSSLATCMNIVSTIQLLSISNKLHAWTACKINQLMSFRLCKLHVLWVCYMISDNIYLLNKMIRVTYCFYLKHTVYISTIYFGFSFSKYCYQLSFRILHMKFTILSQILNIVSGSRTITILWSLSS